LRAREFALVVFTVTYHDDRLAHRMIGAIL
jgi:hypothetical protein